MHRPLNTIRTEYPVNFSEMKKMAPLLESISQHSGAGYYTLDFLVGDVVAVDWKHVIRDLLQREKIEDPPPRDHPVYDRYVKLKALQTEKHEASTVKEDNKFLDHDVTITIETIEDILVPSSALHQVLF